MRVEVVAGEELSLRTSQVTRLVAVRVEERRQSDDDIGCNEQRAFEVVAAAVQNQEVDHERGDEETDGLEQGKVQRHVFAHAPAQDDDEGSDEDSWTRVSGRLHND